MKLHNFMQRLVYGIGMANFIAVTQLISAPQFELDQGIGPVGMKMMIINVPLSFGYALYSDLFTAMSAKSVPKNFSMISGLISGTLFAIGTSGLALAFGSFRSDYLTAFCVAGIVPLIAALVRLFGKNSGFSN
jgi:hypothetical protein